MKAVTAAQMRELDRQTIAAGTPGETLMERAGAGVARCMTERWLDQRGPILLLAGKGNNGGDAFVAARHLAARSRSPITVALVGREKEIQGDALVHFRRLPGSVRVVAAADADWESARVIVDGLLGTGLDGPVRSPYREWIERINACRLARIVAIDIPSGLHADRGEPLGVAVRADLTVTMGLPKIGLLQAAATDWVGELEVVDIGIPSEFVAGVASEAELITRQDMAPLFPRRKRSAHKGDFGHLLVLAGAEGYHGAAVLCAEAAARAGAGLVTLGVPARIYPPVAAQCREVMVRPFADTREGSFSPAAVEEVVPWLERCDAAALGPGLSQHPETQQFVFRLIETCPRPLVIDADGLNALAGRAEELARRQAPLVLTPHPGEMARLIGRSVRDVQADRWGVARLFATETGVTLVLKGAGTVVAGRDPKAANGGEPQLWVNRTGSPALAKGGSGDILTGLIGSFLAQGFTTLDAARAGVFLHGRAADLAVCEQDERCVLAREVLDHLSDAITDTLGAA